VTRVVIDAPVDGPAKIYVTRFADGHILKVLMMLDGAEIMR
jgi:hypothetical protein